MKILRACKAKDISKKAIESQINYQRQYCLDKIKNAALLGNYSIVIDNPRIRLFEDDFLFFESLGYKTTRQTFSEKQDNDKIVFYYGYPTISW